MKVQVIGDATLYLADCREVLPDLKVDHVITDPPYGARTHSMARTSKKETARSRYRQGASRFIDFQFLEDAHFVEITKLCMQAAKRWTVMTCDHRHAGLTFDWPEHIRLGAWVKIAPMPSLSGDRPGSGHESVLILHGAGPKRWNRRGGAAIWRMAPMKSATEVATQKPVALAEAFVSDFTDAGETVLDPFAGSGTIGIACVSMGRKYVGIEKDPRHFDVACRRIEDAQRQGRLIA
ncbi:site-specific DNA-methyltransferase [uncultured Stenotrophomonas sp.]|uniref:DNA-methyltransferase n=1 Tax=uncultured Stenotrophomonas sp. TaxID=165438 RepID=UPI0028E24DE3|nr:site-specific DNA-methyltransferase [uncultured Stenotrophomonas sp.]